jgi:hypothetical protein
MACAITSELTNLIIDFDCGYITSLDEKFLNINQNYTFFSNDILIWEFEKNGDIYYIKYKNSCKNDPKYIGSANLNNKVYLYASKCNFTKWKIIKNNNTYTLKYVGDKCHRYTNKIVIVRYDEKIKWIEPYADQVIVYNKGEHNLKPVFKTVYNVENIGKESYTYLHYIITNYYDLPDRVTFLRGNSLTYNETLLFAIEHIDKLSTNQSLAYRYLKSKPKEIEKNLNKIKKVTNFGLEYTELIIDRNLLTKKMDEYNLNLIKEYHAKYRNIDYICTHFLSSFKLDNFKLPVMFAYWQSCLFSVKRESILSNPINFYKNLSIGLAQQEDQYLGNQVFERLWLLIFTQKIPSPLSKFIPENKIALVLRGHIRNGFDTDDLYNFVKNLKKRYSNLVIYIHTWSVQQSSISWRQMDAIDTEITESTILNYFRDIPIRNIIIDDDTKIKLIGNISGNICKSITPIKGWKNMWYGKARVLNIIYEDIGYIINMRLDYFGLYSMVVKDIPRLLSIINPSNNTVIFQSDSEEFGIDNYYCGPLNIIKKVTNNFNENLDSILTKYPNVYSPEFIVFFEYNPSRYNSFSYNHNISLVKFKKGRIIIK